MELHNKLIQNAAKQILKPFGMFQIGTSRTWLDDQGWYCIQVEFQPSAYSKGAYMNAGVGFLWESTEQLDETIAFNVGYREKSQIKYNGDDIAFLHKMLEYADHAANLVAKYRRFSDFDHAIAQLKEIIAQKQKGRSYPPAFWEYYDLSMMCFLSEKLVEGNECFAHFLNVCAKNNNIDWHKELYLHCENNLLPLCNRVESAKQMVLDMIARKRSLLRNKRSYRKLRIDDIYS